MKRAEKTKVKTMSTKQKEKYRKGKRDAGSDSDYSYRSVHSAGGTRRVMRRRKRDDGTYSDEQSYHSSQDEDGEARRRRRRREREHADSDHSYYSIVSAGGTRHVRRKRRHADGTYSDSESYRSGMNSDGEGVKRTKSGRIIRKGDDDDDDDYDEDDLESDVSVVSVVSAGGTRRVMQKKRIRDADGNIVGYGDPKPVNKKGSKAGKASLRGNDALNNLQQKRGGELLREKTTDSLTKLRDDGEPLISNTTEWPGKDTFGKENKLLAEEYAKIPSDFSDATTDDDVDLSKLTPAQRRQYFAEKDKRRKEREARRREKYGDKYDEIIKKKNARKYGNMTEQEIAALKEEEKEKDRLKIQSNSMQRRKSSAASMKGKGGRPKSMVTYDKGPPRDIIQASKKDNREIGLGHDDWTGKRDAELLKKSRRGSDASDTSDLPPKLHRETTMIKPLPTITQGKIYSGEDGDQGGSYTNRTNKSNRYSTGDDEEEEFSKKTDEPPEEKEIYFEKGKDGRLLLKKKNIDLNNITADELKALGIDPNMSAKDIAKKLKQMFGNDIKITQGGVIIGLKDAKDFGSNADEKELADDPDLDVDTLSGLKRVNVIMRKGGAALQDHLQKVISLSRLVDKYAKDLDERDADIDFLSHYRLVDPSRLDSYARAFVVEDSDLDTVLNSHETKVALDGVPSLQHMNNKQMDYVMKVLKIDEATLITFRMFAVLTALCERVTHMDSLSQKLLEICNLADIERKLDLYKSMFYTNVESDRSTNFITSESLKIELIAGGLNWTQQQYILEKMEANDWGEISFLDYMCYIPLFLSMHDNICYNPLDMSNQKYAVAPRSRRPSVQRDMNPLGNTLTKQSAYWTRKKTMELMQGSTNNSVQVSKSYMDILNKYTSDKYTRLKKIDDQRRQSMTKEKTNSSFSSKDDMIF